MTAVLIIAIPMIAACVIAFILGCCWQAGRADDRDEQLIAEIQAMRGDPCPWPQDFKLTARPNRIAESELLHSTLVSQEGQQDHVAR